MTLPPPDPGNKTRWKEYEINTPTFQLTPVEKPDMSPFLVHMTGKDSIIGILQGRNAPNRIDPSQGYLKSARPEQSQTSYKAEVVCFTESPTFALDFFRYRSYRRWRNDQRFGIGFDKSSLVEKGVKPVIYPDEGLLLNILFLHDKIIETGIELKQDNEINRNIIEMLTKVYPLLFPLLEDEQREGYMWEREWRYPNSGGFIFNHQDIRIICCPENEEGEIRQVLDQSVHGIQVIRTWREYDDITDYLRRQYPIWRKQNETIEHADTNYKKILQLKRLVQQYKIALNSLASFEEFISRFDTDKIKVQEEKNKLNEQLKALQKQVDDLAKEANV